MNKLRNKIEKIIDNNISNGYPMASPFVGGKALDEIMQLITEAKEKEKKKVFEAGWREGYQEGVNSMLPKKNERV